MCILNVYINVYTCAYIRIYLWRNRLSSSTSISPNEAPKMPPMTTDDNSSTYT